MDIYLQSLQQNQISQDSQLWRQIKKAKFKLMIPYIHFVFIAKKELIILILPKWSCSFFHETKSKNKI